MKFGITLLLGILLSGCSLDLSGEDNARPVRIPSIRTSGVDPVSVIDASSLQTDDILLSSSTSLTSWGIRLFSTAGVSHAAMYIGENQVAEAVGKGIKIITLKEAMQEGNNLLALRLASLTLEQANTIRSYTLAHRGEKYNYKGIVMFAPFLLTRRV